MFGVWACCAEINYQLPGAAGNSALEGRIMGLKNPQQVD